MANKPATTTILEKRIISADDRLDRDISEKLRNDYEKQRREELESQKSNNDATVKDTTARSMFQGIVIGTVGAAMFACFMLAGSYLYSRKTGVTGPTAIASPTAISSVAAPVTGYEKISLAEISQGTPIFATIDMRQDPVYFGNIPFDLTNRTVTQCQGELANQPDTFHFDVNIPGASNVYFLMQGGNGIKEFSGKDMGYVLLNFDSGLSIVERLVMGVTIRDWARERSFAVTTITDPSVKSVWEGLTTVSYLPSDLGEKTGIDMITINIPAGYGNLTKIWVGDTSTQVTGISPCLQLYGITVEYKN